MTRRLLVLFALQALLAVAHAAPWTDDFTRPRRYERWGVDCWQLGGGRAAFTGGGDNSFLIATGPTSREITVEADLTIQSRVGSSWATTGLTVFRDAMNHWRLLLVEGPRQDRYFELIEMYEGQHQAQNSAESPRTSLEGTTTGDLKEWAYDKPYHLKISLNPQGITGTITDPATNLKWERSFSFARGLAVQSGRAGLMSSQMSGHLARLTVDAVAPPAGSTLAVASGPRGAIALVPDEKNAVAPRLAEMLRGAGYGVTVIPWEQLDRTLPWDQLDLVILADARRVPVAAQELVSEAVACSGKVMCLGAPAFSTLLSKTPEGWLPPDEWLQSYAKTIPHRPIAIAPEWQRQSSNGDLPGRVSADPASGPAAWKIESELKGWDTWRADVERPFDETHRLLTFQAKGDATTSQLSIELDEADGARWITIVDLTTEWQTFVLPPGAFSYWYDSKAKNRGGAGDRLRPENVTAIIFGLASSHTKSVRPGAHTYWLRDIATAEGQDVPEPGTFTLEALCPSYKLYPMDQVARLWSAAPPGTTLIKDLPWSGSGYSPVWRESGRGLHRGRPWRWVPIVDALDRTRHKLGTLVSLMIGNAVHPDAIWASVGVADPSQALEPDLFGAVVDTISAMVRGCFLVEGGAELFSYKPGETAVVGGSVINLSRQPRDVTIRCSIKDDRAETALDEQRILHLEPLATEEVTWTWKPTFAVPGGYGVTVTLRSPNYTVIDAITHRIEPTRTAPARPEEIVQTSGSNFALAGKPWHFRGINYWGNWIAGYPSLNVYQRPNYDPEIIERDLAQLQALGVNALSAVQALVPPDPDAPQAYRDQRDFLDRCDRHGIKVFFFLHGGRPYHGGSFAAIKDYITRAGIKDHPAIMCWELAWEPIDTPWQGRLDVMIPDWNRWIVQRYGSLQSAFADWGFTPELNDKGQVPIPDVSQCQKHGAWDRYVAAFRRAHSDLISAAYRDIAEPLRQWDPQHLVSFRGGACGIPWQANFAHIQSAGAAKHMDFLNPEGYNLQTSGHGTPTPPDEIRKGGLVTLLYRFTSREKPIVWMEFGYTVNGINTDWQPELVHLKPQQLQNQADELQRFYDMFLESGARGAAPWWWPGGYRIGENSDFGLCEPDGTERPACDVLRQMLPRFAQVQHPRPTDFITLDFDQHGPDSWPLYSQQYLDLVKAGKTPYVKTAGTGTTSANCPLVAVGGMPCNGHNPPAFLNAEFNSLEVKVAEGAWQAVQDGQSLEAPVGAKVLCRASVGNLGEAKWLAPDANEGQPREGWIFLTGRQEYGLPFSAPLAADTDYLADGTIKEFVLIPAVAAGESKVSFEMNASGRAWFGERRTLTIKSR